MRFAFFGTPEFAAVVLEKLIAAGFVPDAVVCNPDRPVGRKKIVTPPPVKQSIMCHVSSIKDRIKILQPEVLSTYDLQPITHNLDFGVVAAYAKLIKKEILEIPRLGVIGVHPSLLPKYRGASPIQSVILNGEEETGVTLYLMDEKMDHGPVLESRKWKIESRINYLELQKQLAELAGDLLIETIPKFLEGKIKPQVQDESTATFTKKFTTRDAFIGYKDLLEAEKGDLEKALKINRMIRAFVLEPGAWTLRPFDNIQDKQVPVSANATVDRQDKLFRLPQGKQQRVKLLESEIKGASLKLKKIQVEGEKPKLVSG